MPSSILLVPLLSLLFTVVVALPSFPSLSSLIARDALSDCENILDNGFNGTCYDVLDIDGYIKKWNLTTTTCQHHELWANCFMREAGVPPESGFGCAEIGNSCNEPTVDLVTNATAEATYTAVSIYSFQQLYTALYNDIAVGVNSSEYISIAWSNVTTPVTGKKLLAAILYADDDPRSQFLGHQISANISIPGVDDTALMSQEQAPKVLGNVIAGVLLSAMTNFTVGWYYMMANHGRLIV